MKTCKYYKPYMKTLRRLVGRYHSLEDCCSGGPLHILLDDDNYDITSIDFCIKECYEGLINGEYSKEACLIGLMICNEYAKMSIEERGVFDSFMTGMVINQCPGDCSECDLLGEFHDFMKENEEDEK